LLGGGCKKEPTPLANTAYTRGELSFQHGDLKEALNQVDLGLSTVGNGESDEFWRLQLLKAEIFIWQGRNEDAAKLLKARSSAEPNSALAARRSTLLGITESNLQQLDLAEQTFHATEEMKGAASPEVLGDLLLGEGKLAAFRRDPERSEVLFKRAFQVAQHYDQAFLASKALGNLGMLQMQQYHFADAVDLFNASLEEARRVDSQASIVKTTINLGWAYRRMGDLDRASELFQLAERKAEQLGMLTDQTLVVMSLAMIRFIQHDFSAAEREYQQALRLARLVNNPQQLAFCLVDLAQTEIEENEIDLAEKHNNEALQLERSLKDYDTELYSLVNEAQIASLRADDLSAEALLEKVIRDARANVEVEVLALSISARIETQLKHNEAARMHFNAALQSLERERKSLGRDELKLPYPTNAKDTYSDYIQFLVSQSMPDEAFRVAELQRARTLTDGLGFNDSNSQTFNAAQAEGAALRLRHPILSYWIGTKASYLWIVLPDHTQLFVLPGEDRIRPLVERYRAHLVGALGGNDLADADGSELYRILIGPVEHWIKPQSEVTIISDGPLCGLNFETLVVKAPTPHYWIEDVSITNASSAFLLAVGSHARALHPLAAPQNLLLIGNPESPPNYPPLSHAGEEISLISEHFRKDQETVLSGKEATPAAYFKAKPAHYGLIHFVAHGTASRISPLDSAVVLSQDGSSYNLYARDIAANRLHADLVTISACDSAGSRIYSSEGLVGLSWAFLRAGARRVIASLWEVNDASTPKLMDHLYSAITAGEEPAVALRNAKLSLLHSQTVYSRPFYWAPFVLYEGT
jgi:CHAT domain-containing protein